VQTISDGGRPVATISICETPGRPECRVGSPAPDMGPASPSQRTFHHGTGPVCGMDVQPEQPAGPSDYRGRTFYFCCNSCKETFDKDP